MKLQDNVTLKSYSEKANKEFDAMESRLSEVENSFQTRMNGKTTGGLAGALFGTILWLVVFAGAAFLVKDMLDRRLILAAFIVAVALIVFMAIDNIMDFSYYGKIESYSGAISQLQNRVRVGRSAITENHDAFMRSKAKGWNYQLSAAPSIPYEATSIETTMAGMESLKKGFISNAKNVLFFATVIAVSLIGCYVLFPFGGDMVQGIMDGEVPYDTLTILNFVAMVIVCIVEVILAKLVWSKTDCEVTGKTLFIIALAPVAYLALMLVGAIIVRIVLWAISLLLTILAVVFGGAIVFGSISGG